MSKVIEKLVERTPIAVIVLGTVLVALGAIGGFPFIDPPILITEPSWRIALGLIGGVLVLVGVVLLWQESRQSSREYTDRAAYKGIRSPLRDYRDHEDE